MDSISIIPIQFATPEYDQMIRLRNELLKKPLGLEFEVSDLAKEFNYHHLVAYNAHLQMVACLVLVPKEKGSIQMIQVAVRESLQGNGIGSQLVKASEAFAQDLGYEEMMLHARDTAVSFYTKLHYEKYGKPFEEVGIEHFRMRKKLRIDA